MESPNACMPPDKFPQMQTYDHPRLCCAGWVDRSLFLGVLIVMSQGLWEEKLEALWGALSEGQETVYLHTAASFVNTMKVVFESHQT